VHRDYQSVLRDIVQPSFAINPDHLTHTILLKDGRVLTGVLASSDNRLIVGDKEGKRIEISPSDVEEMRPSKLSIMPEGIAKELAPEAMRDLLTFLLTPPPRMPRDLEGAPEPRTLAEVEKVLDGAEEIKSPRPLRIVLVAGRKDHGPGEHDYPAWLKVWGQLLEAAENVEVTQVMEWPSAKQLAAADALVFYQQGTWNEQRAADIDAFLKKGGGVSYIHYAVDGGKEPEGFADRIGLAWQGGASKFRHGGLDLIFDSKHPIARNFRRVHFHDESYWNLKGNPEDITLLASGREENALQPLIWCREKHQGRVFVSIPGHYSWTFDDPLFRILLLRGIAWSAGESVDRFNSLITPGASIRIAP
jgi:putative heme-binding domain-containing protein